MLTEQQAGDKPKNVGGPARRKVAGAGEREEALSCSFIPAAPSCVARAARMLRVEAA